MLATPSINNKNLLQEALLENENTCTTILSDLKDWVCESAIFAWRFIKSPKTLGTPFPFSPFVAKEILKFVNHQDGESGHLYLEVGAGTGAMTRHLVKKLKPKDRLYIVEIDKILCNVLKRKYANHPNVYIHNGPIQDWNSPDKFDVIITTVPLNSLPSAETLTSIFDTFKRLIKPNGVISSAEYIGTSTLCQICYFGETKSEFNKLYIIKNEFFEQNGFERTNVLLNLPPSRVTHCRINTSLSSN